MDQSVASEMVEDKVYEATLLDRFGTKNKKGFRRLNEAIIYLAREFAAGDGNAVYGEIRLEGALVWRRAPPGFRADRPLA